MLNAKSLVSGARREEVTVQITCANLSYKYMIVKRFFASYC